MRALVAIALVASCSALQLAAVRPPPRAMVRCAEEPDNTFDVAVMPPPKDDEERAERDAAIAKAEAEDPLMIAAGGDSDFVRWYRFEKAKDEYLEQSDPASRALEKLKGPASSLAILAAGFYIIPFIRGVADSIRDGNAGALLNNMANPTEVLKF